LVKKENFFKLSIRKKVPPPLLLDNPKYQKRSFQCIRYKNKSLLEYSIKNDSYNFYCCRHFSANKLNVGNAFITTGFSN
jgi:hypothetical protein